MDAVTDSTNPRPVSRGSKPVIGFTGIDCLYLVVEYPHEDLTLRSQTNRLQILQSVKGGP
jgi:hypothetical protein